jgi:hypothetical protein
MFEEAKFTTGLLYLPLSVLTIAMSVSFLAIDLVMRSILLGADRDDDEMEWTRILLGKDPDPETDYGLMVEGFTWTYV